jgi:N-methylhydantoinase B
VLRLVEGGRLREDLWRLLLLNTRTPDLLDGDLRAMLGAAEIGAGRVAALVEELGPEAASAYFAGILDHADRRFRAALAALPEGVYEAVETIDNDCFETMEIAIRLRLTLAGGRLTVDFTGSDPQMRGFKNSSLANTYSAVYMALLAFFEPDLPRNEGAFRSVEIVAPEGTVVNPLPPAPVTMCTVFIAHEIIHVVWRALAQADPARSCAGWGKNIAGVTSGRAADGRRFVLYHWGCMPGGGAIRGRDGFAEIGHLIALGGLTLPNAETTEQLYPVRVLKQELRCDAGGAGEFRGGPGVDYAIEVEAPADYAFRAEGLGAPSGYGVLGGGWGAGGRMVLAPQNGPAETAPKYGVRRFPPLRLEGSSPGGGGWGDPLDREPARVLRDVRDGVVSAAAAREVYGVALAGGGVDEAATAALRGEMRQAHRPPP